MKLALILLNLFCLYLSVSHQQQQRRFPLPNYYSSFYGSPQQLSRNWMMRQGPYYVVRNVQPSFYSPPSFDEQIPAVVIITRFYVLELN